MTITRSRLALLLCCLIATQAVAAPPKFTSVYTDLAKDCRADDEVDVEGGEEEEGEDVPLICKGYGPYRGFIFFSAIDSVFQVQSAAAPHAEQSGQISIKDYDKGMIEWRLADGQPFAVIARAVDVDEDGARRPAGLIVQGLGKLASSQARIPTAKNPRANEQAREAADAMYAP